MQMVFLSNMSFFSFLPLGFFILSLIKWFHTLSKPRRNLPPSPPKLPVLGNLHQLGLLPHRSLHSFSRKYGPLMLIHLGSKPVLVASSADAAREIMKNHELVFANRHKSSICDRLLYGSRNITFSAYGEYWKKIRSISVLHLLSNKKVQSFRDVREEETSIMIEKIRQRCSSSSVINLSEIFGTLSNDVVCRVILGRKYGDDENGRQVRAMLLELMEMLGVFNIGDFIPWLEWVNRLNGLDVKLKRLSEQLDEFLETVIEEHKNNRKEAAKSSDFVDILLDLQQKNFNSFPIECDTLKALLLEIFAAGTDTTQTIMEWEMTELLRHPNILEKLQREVREVAAGRPEITEVDLAKMQYLKAVIKETLRLHSPAPLLVPREASQDIEMMGYSVAAGTRAIVNAWAIGRDPQLWEKPEEYQPERFLNSNIDFRGSNFDYIPFGAGRRICPGSTFAMAINELGLAKLVHKFNFAMPDGAKPEDLDMTETSGITVHKNIPLFVLATPYSCN